MAEIRSLSLSLSLSLYIYSRVSQLLQYFVRHNSTALDAFAKVVKVTNLPDTIQMLLIGFVSMVRSFALKFMVLDLPNFTWPSKSLQPEQNFMNNLITALWSTAPSSFTQMFLVVSMFLCAAFKSHTKWNNAQQFTNNHNTINHSRCHKLVNTKMLQNF